MSAFFIANVVMKNPEKFKEYAEKARSTFEEYEGEILARGMVDEVLCGNHQSGSMVAVVKFKSIEILKAWYNSSSYQALIPLREEAAEMTITSYVMPV